MAIKKHDIMKQVKGSNADGYGTRFGGLIEVKENRILLQLIWLFCSTLMHVLACETIDPIFRLATLAACKKCFFLLLL
jgi:hypothetical protein